MSAPAIYQYQIPDGLDGIYLTLALMAELARSASLDSDIRARAVTIISDVPARDTLHEAVAIFNFVQARIRYTGDAEDAELLSHPAATLQSGVGDCDDMATLLAALLLSVGISCQFVAVGFHAGELQHVYVAALINGQWVSLDPTEPYPAGWTPPNIVEMQTWPV